MNRHHIPLASCRRDFSDADADANPLQFRVQGRTATQAEFLESVFTAVTHKQGRITVIVHGYNNKLEDIVEAYRKVADGIPNSAVVGFVWPGGDDWLEYEEGSAQVPASAVALRQLLSLLSSSSTSLFLHAHSLGCRVSLTAMRGSSVHVSAALLCGAAVPDNCLLPGQEFDRTRLNVGSIVVIWSANDPVLSQWYRWGEASTKAGWLRYIGLGILMTPFQRPALGCSPPTQVPGVRYLNISATLNRHDGYNVNAEARGLTQQIVSAAP
jgi:hypothetical protein